MAGIRGQIRSTSNQNAFKHGLAGITQRRANGALTADDQAIRQQILAGLVSDKGGEAQIRMKNRPRIICAERFQDLKKFSACQMYPDSSLMPSHFVSLAV